MREITRNQFVHLYPYIFVLLWASGFVFAKMGLDSSEPFTLLSLRYFFAALIFFILFIIKKPEFPTEFVIIKNITITGVLMQVVFFSFVYNAIKFGVSAGLIALIASMQPIIVGLISPSITGEKINTKQWLGLFLGMIGAAIVIVFNKVISSESLIGLFLAIGALLTMSAVALFEKKYGKDYDMISANLIQFIVGLVITTPLAIFIEGYRFVVNQELLISLFYLVIANSFVAVTLLLAMIRAGEVAKVSSLFYLIPPISTVIAWMLLGEEMTAIAVLGLFITVFAVGLVRK